MVWCSMPPPQVNSASPYFSSRNGYSPKRAAKAAIMPFTFAFTPAA